MILAGFPSSSFTSKVTLCAPALSSTSPLDESVFPAIEAATSTPSTKILPLVKSSAELSATVAEKAILFPLITAPFSSVTAVSDVEYVGSVIVGSSLSSTAEL